MSVPDQRVNNNDIYNSSDLHLDFYISEEEVAFAAERAKSDSAPGPDGIQMKFWKKIPGACRLLALLFNKIIKEGRVPEAWLRSRLILLPKSEDSPTNDPSLYRPISITDTAYRLFMSAINRKLSDNISLSPSQKGFLEGNGCMEHSFLLQEVLDTTRRDRKPLSVAWLDIRKAFDSIPHSQLLEQIQRKKFPSAVVKIIQNLYANSYATVTDNSGATAELRPNGRGVRKGCPLSPLLFNITIDPFLREMDNSPDGFKVCEERISALCYADDVVLLAHTQENIQKNLEKFESFCNSHQLAINHAKSAALTVTLRGAKRVLNEKPPPTIQSTPLLTLKDPKQFYKYLGTDKNLKTLKT